MNILAINAGSTSLKFGLFDADARAALLSGKIEWADGHRDQATLVMRSPEAGEVRETVAVLEDRAAATCAIERAARHHAIALVGHRVVHGGAEFDGSQLINARVKEVIARFSELAPLHNPPALAGIEAAEAALPGRPQVAVFDTAFFARLPPRACVYPLPYEWFTEWGLRRIGFHGISHAYCASRAAELLGRAPADLRLVTCHLGGGCSATAVRGGIPVATTMGFTPLEGLMMGTRPGSVDPGLLIHLQRHFKLSVDELDRALNQCSGLLGVSGLSAGLAQIEAAALAGHARARLAFDMFTDRVRAAIGALAVQMAGLDALVFTARAGEVSAILRAAVCEGLECLGLQLDPERNAAVRPDADVAAPGSPARILVIRTEEELAIAREARRVNTVR